MMRITAIAILVVGAAVCSVSRASAQAPEVRAKVPFDFVVENRTLPAGDYRIQPHEDFMLIESQDGNAAVFVTASQGETRAADGKAKLYFDVVGGNYYLRRVASSTAESSKALPACKMEKKAEVLRASHDRTEVINAVASR